MKLNTYLNFGGNCAEAFRFYAENLGGKIGTIMTFDQSPEPTNTPPDWKGKVLHARLSLGETELMGSDIPKYQPVRSAYLTLSVGSDAEADRIYKALADGGEVSMKIQETFFATRFAQVRDRFGVLWMIIHEKPMPANP